MVNMLVKCAALETAYFGIRINAVAPGVTISETRTKEESLGYTANENRAFLKEAAKDVPLNNELNSPKDVAHAMLWLSSTHASFITGEVLVIDGGQSLSTTNF